MGGLGFRVQGFGFRRYGFHFAERRRLVEICPVADARFGFTSNTTLWASGCKGPLIIVFGEGSIPPATEKRCYEQNIQARKSSSSNITKETPDSKTPNLIITVNLNPKP